MTTRPIARRDFLARIAAGGSIAAAASLGGCRPQEANPAGSAPGSGTAGLQREPLHLIVVDDPPLAAAIERRWAAEDRGPLRVTPTSAPAIRDSSWVLPADCDAVVFPFACEADLIDAGQLVPVPAHVLDSDLVARGGWLPAYSSRAAAWSGGFWSLPVGAATLMLVEGPDLKAAGGPPGWQRYQADPAAEPESAARDRRPGRVVYPDAGAWLAWSLLVHAVPMFRSIGEPGHLFVVETMEPLVDSPPFVAALEQMMRTAARPGTIAVGPVDVFRMVASGEAQAGLGWPGGMTGQEGGAAGRRVKFLRPPGSSRWFSRRDQQWRERGPEEARQFDVLFADGRAVGVTTASLQAGRAFELAAWLDSSETGRHVAPASDFAGPFRTSSLGRPEDWLGGVQNPDSALSWVEAMNGIHQSRLPFVFPGVRQPQRYLEALARAVREVLVDDARPDLALAGAADAWRSITRDIGIDLQRKAMQRRGY